MINKLFATIGLVILTAGQPTLFHRPYKKEEVNVIYNLLFCDNLQLFKSNYKGKPWITLLSPRPNLAELKAIAEDESQESRLRVLAYNRLRHNKQPVPSKRLLAVIIEVRLEEGLDVLAAFPDGRVRYINHSEKMSIFEASPPEVATRIKKLLSASQSVVDRIGPWESARLPPPAVGSVRITFLVSDGLYFGQGPYMELRRDPTAGAVLAAGEELLTVVIEKSLQG